MCNSAIKFENWKMKNKFSIFNFPIKIDNWKLNFFYHFSIFNFEVKNEMRKNALLIRDPKGSFVFQLNWKLQFFQKSIQFQFENWILTSIFNSGHGFLFYFNFKLKIEWHFRCSDCFESEFQKLNVKFDLKMPTKMQN